MSPTPAQWKRLQEHVIAALDLDTLDEAIALVDVLQDRLSKFKVGSRLFTRYGPTILEELDKLGAEVFLDLKFHDIPSVVGDACKNGASHRCVFLMTVHASGGRAMIEAAARGVTEGAAGHAGEPPKAIAVTALTSLSQHDATEIGIPGSIQEWASHLARLAVDSGAGGLVCSPHEVAKLRASVGEGVVLVTPGIRFAQPAAGDDQVRTMTPAQALAAGSDYLVIGRPIYKAADPRAAVEEIARSL